MRMTEPWRNRLARLLFGDVIAQEVALAVKVIDDRWWQQVGGGRAGTLDRDWWEMSENLADALEAWRTNPLARQIVRLITTYVVSDGIEIGSSKAYVDAWFQRFSRHRLNHLRTRYADMCDELSRSGELFPVLSRNPADGMSYVRFVPAAQIVRIETDGDDIERELVYVQRIPGAGGQERRWLSWDHPEAAGESAVMGHFAINRPIGAVRGEGDLVPILPWLKRYKVWLEDRAKLNRYKSRFYWDVTIEGTEADISAARARYASPPEDGSIIVHSAKETWQPVQPKIESEDAEADGRALRLMVASGGGVPLHFLGEGESATRATAVEMGDPTFRFFEQRQLQFRFFLEELYRRAYDRAVQIGRARSYGEDAGIWSRVPDIVRKDNLQLAEAANQVVSAFALMKAQGWISDEIAVRLAFKFAGEVLREEDILRILEGARAQSQQQQQQQEGEDGASG